MGRAPTPPHLKATRRSAGGWLQAPGPVKRPPRAPEGLGDTGITWWRAAWRSCMSGWWEMADRLTLERGARLADRCAAPDTPITALAELRKLEDALGLTRKGRLMLRVLNPGESPPAPVQEAPARRRMLAIDPAGPPGPADRDPDDDEEHDP